MDIIKSPQDTISAYLYNAINIEIFEEYELTKCKGGKEPLEFFNLLFSEFAFFKENIENYLIIKSHFEDYSDDQNYVKINKDNDYSYDMLDLYQALTKLIDDKYPFDLRQGVILKSCEYIESILKQLKKILFDYTSLMDNVIRDIKDLEYKDKVAYLIKIKYLSLADEKKFEEQRGMTIAALCDREIEKLERLYQLEDESTKEPEKLIEIDLSNSTAVQKIIYLKELGIIDLLIKEQCFLSSTRNLAVVLSAITGEEPTTLQPILNPMLSKNTAQKNNPYSSKSTVEKVKSQLINLGVQSK